MPPRQPDHPAQAPLQKGGSSESQPQGRLQGDEGLWAFIATDMVLFATLFGSYAYQRTLAKAAFDAHQTQLHPAYAIANTLLLLSSSWLMALAVARLRRGERVASGRLLAVAFALGLAFVVSKISEYSLELRAGRSPVSAEFFTYYFVITGLHLLHVIGGLAALAVLWRRLGAAAVPAPSVRFAESAAVFWHLVDLLWLVIFPLLYLLH